MKKQLGLVQQQSLFLLQLALDLVQALPFLELLLLKLQALQLEHHLMELRLPK
jgi:hypothetical protein